MMLSEVGVDDLTSIIRLQVSLGEALSMAQQINESVAAYQDALRVSIHYMSYKSSGKGATHRVFGKDHAIRDGFERTCGPIDSLPRLHWTILSAQTRAYSARSRVQI
jgi:hypothetical protein